MPDITWAGAWSRRASWPGRYGYRVFLGIHGGSVLVDNAAILKAARSVVQPTLMSVRPETVYFAEAGVARASAMLIYSHVNCASRNPRALASTK